MTRMDGKIGILIIDDDADSQAALRQVLGSEEWNTAIVPGGNRALLELATGNWTLVVANVATTGVTGALLLMATAMGMSRSVGVPVPPARLLKPKFEVRITVPLPNTLICPCAE